MKETGRITEVMARLVHDALFEEFVEWLEERQRSVQSSMRTNGMNMTQLMLDICVGREAELSHIISTIKSAEDKLRGQSEALKRK